jgi:hypothetical protein
MRFSTAALSNRVTITVLYAGVDDMHMVIACAVLPGQPIDRAHTNAERIQGPVASENSRIRGLAHPKGNVVIHMKIDATQNSQIGRNLLVHPRRGTGVWIWPGPRIGHPAQDGNIRREPPKMQGRAWSQKYSFLMLLTTPPRDGTSQFKPNDVRCLHVAPNRSAPHRLVSYHLPRRFYVFECPEHGYTRREFYCWKWHLTVCAVRVHQAEQHEQRRQPAPSEPLLPHTAVSSLPWLVLSGIPQRSSPGQTMADQTKLDKGRDKWCLAREATYSPELYIPTSCYEHDCVQC